MTLYVHIGRVKETGIARLTIATNGIFLRDATGCYKFKPPWSPPLFSERYGPVRVIFRLFGFRLFRQNERQAA